MTERRRIFVEKAHSMIANGSKEIVMDIEEIKLDRDMIRKENTAIKQRLRDISGLDTDDIEELMAGISRLRGVRDRARKYLLRIEELEIELQGTRSLLESYKKIATDRVLTDWDGVL